MQSAPELDPDDLLDFLLEVTPVASVFVWGQPGIGKSSLVEFFAASVGLECVSLLGTQLAPEDLIGVPAIEETEGRKLSRFCPPSLIARTQPYCLFIDELNGSSQEVQKAFYSLITEHRIGEYTLPKGSIVVGAGNRAEDGAIVKRMSTALINRLVMVQLRATARAWLTWADQADCHPAVRDYIALRPDHLWSKPPKHEESFSTPRTWHLLSDMLKAHGDKLTERRAEICAKSVLTPEHAVQFVALYRQRLRAFDLAAIIKGEIDWPARPEERDVLAFMVGSFRAQLIKEMPAEDSKLSAETRNLSMRAKDMVVKLSRISMDFAQLIIANDEKGVGLPDWFILELSRDLPRLSAR